MSWMTCCSSSDRFLTWNRNFVVALGCRPEELRAVPASELVVFEPGSPEELAECD
jgi:hypothetical protein